MSIDYQKELKVLEEHTGDYWKPKAGQYKVIALGELTEAEPFKNDDDSEPQQRASLKVSIDKKEYLWNFPKGKTPASTYGQLIKLGAAKGKIMEEQFTVVVIGEGQNIRFTIVA